MRLLVQALLVSAVSAGAGWASEATRPAGFTERQAGPSGARLRQSPGGVTQIYGPRLSIGRTSGQSSRSFLDAHGRALGIPAAQLKPAGAIGLMSGKFTLFIYEQEINGVPVYGSTLKLLVRNEADHPLVLANSLARFVWPSATQPVIDEAFAVAAARRAQSAAVSFSRPGLYYFGPEGDEVRLVWRFYGDTGQGPGFDRWEFFIDAITGEVVDQRPGLCHAGSAATDIVGTVTGYRTPPPLPDDYTTNPPAELPVYGARVWIDGGATTYTDQNGDFTLVHGGTDPVTVEVDFQGQWATVINETYGGLVTGSEQVTPPGPVSFTLNPAPAQVLTSQVNAITHMTEIHDFVKSLVPEFTGYDFAVPTHVNSDQECNATYTMGSSEVYFSRTGLSDCVNSAYSSVIFHEYGHLVVDQSPDGAGTPIEYHEGMADVLAAFYTNDPCIAPDLFGIGTGCVRDIEAADTVYPNPSTNPYTQGAILSGAFWDMRTELIATEGATVGLDIARDLYIGQVFVGAHRVNPTVTVDVLTLDDDDPDITNGTPHRDEICAGFDAHGLTCPELVYLTFDYPQGRPDMVTPGVQAVVPVTVNPHGGVPVSGSGTLSYRIGSSGSFTTISMTDLGGGAYEAVLPAAGCGRTIEYYVAAEAEGQEDPTYDPPNAPAGVYQMVSADALLVAFSDDFETDQGWTVSNGAGLFDGAWERGVPIGGGDLNDPPTDFDGSGQCYVTANRDGNADVDGMPGSEEGTTTLISPVLDVTGLLEPRVEYARWYANVGGAHGNEDVFEVEVSGNGGTDWVPLETVGPTGPDTAGGWVVRSFRIANFVAVSSEFRISFTASDLGEPSIVEAGIDAFAIHESDCCDIGADCDDGLYCNGLEACVDHVCQSGDNPCDDGVDCTTDICDEETDSCELTPDDAACDDGQLCNGAEWCDAVQGCQLGAAPSCDDGVGCTDDLCDPLANDGAGACVNTANDANCDDGWFCNGAETCDEVSDCQPGIPPSCDDEVACTDDWCDPAGGGGTGACVNDPNDANCDDDVYCNGAETCDPVGDCQASSDPCLGDPITPHCDEDTDQCVECLTAEHCEDQLFCTGTETCAAGVCQSSGYPCTDPTFPVCDEENDLCVWSCTIDEDCDDDFPCTVDACNTAIGGCSNRLFAYGNVNRDATINLFDVLCVLGGISGDLGNCMAPPGEDIQSEDLDLEPCGGNTVVNIFDVLAVLNAIGGVDPCCGG